MAEAFEIDGRNKYKYWYYYEVKIQGNKFYLNVVMLKNGKKKDYTPLQINLKKIASRPLALGYACPRGGQESIKQI